MRPHRPVPIVQNTTINERVRGWGLKRPGDGVATSFSKGILVDFFRQGGGV